MPCFQLVCEQIQQDLSTGTSLGWASTASRAAPQVSQGLHSQSPFLQNISAWAPCALWNKQRM